MNLWTEARVYTLRGGLILKDDRAIYTGQLTYKEVDFTFVFDGKELRLIPPDNKRDEVNKNWLRTPLANGAYTIHIPVIEDICLCGICNETNHRIIFLLRRGEYLNPHGNYLLGGTFFWKQMWWLISFVNITAA